MRFHIFHDWEHAKPIFVYKDRLEYVVKENHSSIYSVLSIAARSCKVCGLVKYKKIRIDK